MHKETVAVGNNKENAKRKAQDNTKGIERTRQHTIRKRSRERDRENPKERIAQHTLSQNEALFPGTHKA